MQESTKHPHPRTSKMKFFTFLRIKRRKEAGNHILRSTDAKWVRHFIASNRDGPQIGRKVVFWHSKNVERGFTKEKISDRKRRIRRGKPSRPSEKNLGNWSWHFLHKNGNIFFFLQHFLANNLHLNASGNSTPLSEFWKRDEISKRRNEAQNCSTWIKNSSPLNPKHRRLKHPLELVVLKTVRRTLPGAKNHEVSICRTVNQNPRLWIIVRNVRASPSREFGLEACGRPLAQVSVITGEEKSQVCNRPIGEPRERQTWSSVLEGRKSGRISPARFRDQPTVSAMASFNKEMILRLWNPEKNPNREKVQPLKIFSSEETVNNDAPG